MLTGDWGDHCERVTLWPCRVRGVRAAIVRPDVADYPAERTELLAPISLRHLFGLKDGARLGIDGPDAVWPPASAAVSGRLDEFDGVIVALDRAALESYNERQGKPVHLERFDSLASTRPSLFPALDRLECQVGVCIPPAGSSDTDAPVGHDSTERDLHLRSVAGCAEELEVTPSNAVVISADRTGAEAASAIDASYIHPQQLFAGR